MGRLKDRIRRAMTVEYWRVCYRKRISQADAKGNMHISDLLSENIVEGFYTVPGPKYVTMADPFLYRYHGQTYLFYEKQDLTDMKGELWSLNLDDPKEKPRKVLEEPFHLSYPQIFQYGKYTYMIPETRGAKEVRLYRCRKFPNEWDYVGMLFPLNAVDTTLYEKEPGMFYFFSYVDSHMEIWKAFSQNEQMELADKSCIYFSQDSDEVRCGGSLLSEDGKLYRICQDCKKSYGGALIITEIDSLEDGEEPFKEHTVKEIHPRDVDIVGLRPVGIHTYNRNDYYEVVDVLHREISWQVIFMKLFWKLHGGN